jgi:TfoX/Sxy family transcriptional regulator of competence genes
MDRDFLIDLFSDFGPVTIRRMFSGFGISADGTNFALRAAGRLYFRADDQTIPQFERRLEAVSVSARTKIGDCELVLALAARLFDDPRIWPIGRGRRSPPRNARRWQAADDAPKGEPRFAQACGQAGCRP